MTARIVAAAVGLALLASACALPVRKDTSLVSRVSATPASASTVVARYNAVRTRADDDLDASLLDRIEGGDLLDIDQGSYFVSVRVNKPPGYARVRLSRPEQVLAPRFDVYPLWFAVMARDERGGNKRVAVFERSDSVSPWLMTIAPETTPQASLPPVVRDDTGAAVTVAADDAAGTGMSPTQAVQRYAEVLSPGGPDEVFADDAFLDRTRAFQEAQTSLSFASFQQAWTAQPPRFALRVEGGGFLVFGTVLRRDSYSVQSNTYIDWDDDADTAAYLPGRVYRSANLDYAHQLLLFVPPQGVGKPRLIGQYGGVVDGEGS